jgi:hypothetical protein
MKQILNNWLLTLNNITLACTAILFSPAHFAVQEIQFFLSLVKLGFTVYFNNSTNSESSKTNFETSIRRLSCILKACNKFETGKSGSVFTESLFTESSKLESLKLEHQFFTMIFLFDHSLRCIQVTNLCVSQSVSGVLKRKFIPIPGLILTCQPT